MKRSEFLKTLLFGSAATATAGMSVAQKPSDKVRYLYSGPINGTYYYEAFEVFERIKHNDQLNLKLQPDNKYDHRAIEVFWGQHKLGYVPRTDNKVIYNLMKNGANVLARVKKIDDLPGAKLPHIYGALRMRIWMAESEVTKQAPDIVPYPLPGLATAQNDKRPYYGQDHAPTVNTSVNNARSNGQTHQNLRDPFDVTALTRSGHQTHFKKLIWRNQSKSEPMTEMPDGSWRCGEYKFSILKKHTINEIDLLITCPTGDAHEVKYIFNPEKKVIKTYFDHEEKPRIVVKFDQIPFEKGAQTPQSAPIDPMAEVEHIKNSIIDLASRMNQELVEVATEIDRTIKGTGQQLADAGKMAATDLKNNNVVTRKVQQLWHEVRAELREMAFKITPKNWLN